MLGEQEMSVFQIPPSLEEVDPNGYVDEHLLEALGEAKPPQEEVVVVKN
jgi:hypothetical protein